MLTAPIIIIVSRKDQAGLNMKEFLLKKSNFEEQKINIPDSWPEGAYEFLVGTKTAILTIPEDQIFTDYFAGYLDTDLLIFASKHSSAAGQKSLLVHTTGVWNKEAGHGGQDHEIAYAPSNLLNFAYNKIKELQEERKLDSFWSGFECTHHGPTSLEVPLMYVETGGTEEEWNDLDACKLIADVIWATVEYSREKNLQQKTAFIGIGGNHYCSSFVKKVDQFDYAIGHVIPKYAHQELPIEMIKEAFEKTLASEKIFLIDKKGARSSDRHRFIDYIEENGWNWEYI
jgi:D-aminoacyl-tRNA deacylase